MAESVVDTLEVIEIEIKYGETRAVTLRAGNFVLHPFRKDAAIGEPRQDIVTGQPCDFEFAGGDLRRHAVEGRRQAIEFGNSACGPGADRPIATSPTCSDRQQALERSSEEPAHIDQGEH